MGTKWIICKSLLSDILQLSFKTRVHLVQDQRKLRATDNTFSSNLFEAHHLATFVNPKINTLGDRFPRPVPPPDYTSPNSYKTFSHVTGMLG